MVEHEVSERLRQRSRASGVLVGLSMALTIVIALTSFIWLYVRLGSYLSDFIPRLPETVTLTPATSTPGTASSAAGTARPAVGSPTVTLSTPSPTPTPAWRPTHRIAEGGPVNFRSGPSTDTQVVRLLDPGTPLMFLGQQQQAGGATWLQLALEDGTVGWIRTIDLEAISAP